MITGIEVLCHSSIRINKGKIIYIDPYKIEKTFSDADIIFITHNHYDHYSPEDINKVKKEDSIIVLTEDIKDEAIKLGFKEERIISVKPNQEYKYENIRFKTVPAYNVNKAFHPKENNWVGYIIKINDVEYYVAGDTDITEENLKVQCDVALIPIGGTYTTDYKEAAKLVNTIKPKVVIPTHYACIVGKKEDADEFSKLIDKEIECNILIK